MPILKCQMIKDSSEKEVPNQSDVYMHSYIKDLLNGEMVSSIGDIETLYDGLKRAEHIYGEINFLGTIQKDETIKYITYRETREYAKRIAQFISTQIEGKDPIIGICAENRAEWTIAEHSTYFFSGINCPIYPSFGWSAVKYILNETKMQMIFVSEKNIEKIVNGMEKERDETIHLPRIMIVMDENISDHALRVLREKNIKIYSFWEIVNKCDRIQPRERQAQKKKEGAIRKFDDPKTAKTVSSPQVFAAPQATTVATICYTSGTTGAPKGAMLMHRNVVSVAGSFILLSQQKGFFLIQNENRYLSFLPLAHVFERIVEAALLLSRCTVIYYRGNPKQLQKDFAIAKPHYFIGVPRVFNSVKMAIETKAKEKGWLANMIFTGSLALCKHFKNKLVREIFGKTVFKVIRETFGGSITCFLSGSAPLSIETAEFFEAVFNCTMFEGYGQTETAAGNITTDLFIREKGVIGIPFPCNKVRLLTRPESNAYVENNQGEILMKGPSVFLGYYNQDQLTKNTFYEDGTEKYSTPYNLTGERWIKTGDIGEITKEGNLRIIGRSKEIFKLSQGEYIVPEKIENHYLDRNIPQLEDIVIVGDSSRDYVIAICMIKENTEQNQALVREAIQKEGDNLVQANELIKIEIPKRIIFAEEPATIENGLLTPSGKKIRPKITALYQKRINSIYAAKDQ
ncbi:long-chain acyl-CoA synthetase [Nematocida sp. AWRm80]|nr:long-chain acyl-CoA synthetase [Nematocida sp. AWRm80]